MSVLSRALSNHYVKIYLVLLVLLVISIVGPTMEILAVTLTTAFGVAAVKAWLVIKHFMHLSIERPIAKWFVAASVLMMVLLWGGVAPDVQKHQGTNWENVDAMAAVERGIAEPEVHGDDEHAEESGDAAEAGHAEEAGRAEVSLVPTAKSTDNLLPGGYNFTHAAFWSVVGLVAVGTNAVAIMLLVGSGLLVLETLKGLRKQKQDGEA